MLWPTVTELPRQLEPSTGDTFVQDLNALAPPRSAPDPGRPEQPPRARRE
jgi:hypothetical protein